jgi:hypothetical protein
MTGPSAAAPQRFAERLTPAWWIWVVAVGFALSFAVVLSRVDLTVAGVAALAVLVLCVWALVRTTARVEVTDGELVAGAARLPLDVVSDVEALDAEAMRRARGVDLDARAYLCLRGWLPGGVRVRLDDPDDDTPYWLVSSRRPQRLAAALDAARTARGR